MLVTQTKSFNNLMTNMSKEILYYLLNHEFPFSIYCDLENISFSPELPSNIKDTFEEYVLFSIINYSFESALLKDNCFIFNAGFGEDFETQIKIPLSSIMHINVDNETIFINMSTYEEEIHQDKINDSMNVFLNNPNNKHLL